MSERPWEEGTTQERWDGYLDQAHLDPEVGQHVLRNLVGATTYDQLRIAEDQHVLGRMASLREEGLPGSYDLEGLRSVHRYLFQDVYEWAGEPRTVPIMKGVGAFAAPEDIAPRMERLANGLREANLLRGLDRENVAEGLSVAYNELNSIHAFREGNGRTQRAFISALAVESGHSVDWEKVQGPTNDMISEFARHGRTEMMSDMFRTIVKEAPAPAPRPRLPGAFSERPTPHLPVRRRRALLVPVSGQREDMDPRRILAPSTQYSTEDTAILGAPIPWIILRRW